MVRRCQIWTNGADLRGAERGNCMPQYKTAQSRRNVREPAGVPPWAGAGFKNFGHQLGKKTKQRVRARVTQLPLKKKPGVSHPPELMKALESSVLKHNTKV